MVFSEKIYKLRQKEKYTQEEFAALFHVSRQAVQKWESGLSLPEMPTVVEIARYFGLSLDELVLGRNSRMMEEISANIEPAPSFEMMSAWEFYADAVMDEYKQSFDEGLDIGMYQPLFEAVARLPRGEIKRELGDVIQKIVQHAPRRKEYAYIEPSQLPQIKSLREIHPLAARQVANRRDRVYGAFMGRICGCMLGKTVEGIRAEELKRLLTQTDNWPMKRYITSGDLAKVDLSSFNYDLASRIFADKISFMPCDDDTNYTVLAQMMYEQCGNALTSEDVAGFWLRYQPKDAYCTAERVAYCNFIKGYRPPQSAQHKNPYREWIGAQIRADYWGYINPGDPEMAAELAWRDASVSHVKNGIYGEMFVAAMLAAAGVTDDIKDVILTGLGQIPSTSRLYADVMQVLHMYVEGQSQQQTFAYIHERYNEGESYGWCHTNSNAMIVVAALLYGKGDFGRSICMAVETGFDTDCNGATVGSVLGMMFGLDCIGEEWSAPFHDMLETTIFGVGKVSISALVDTTMAHIQKNGKV